jgi:hypothetical protein
MPDADASTTDNAPAQVVETTTPTSTATTEPAKPEPKVFDEGYVKALRSEAAKYRFQSLTSIGRNGLRLAV